MLHELTRSARPNRLHVRMHVSGETVALSPPDRYNTVIQPWVSGSSPYWIARSLW